MEKRPKCRLYDEDEYDLAGFAVGAVEKAKVVTGENIVEGDVLIGLASSGVHSNGYSLVRKILFEDNGYEVHEVVKGYEELGPIGGALLVPTKIYAKPVLDMLKRVNVHGMAHVTGGGFYENLPRMMPEGLATEINLGSWPILPIFEFLKDKGALADKDLYNVFNMGIGYVLSVPAEEAQKVIAIAEEHGEKAYQIGRVVKGEGVHFNGEHDGSLI